MPELYSGDLKLYSSIKETSVDWLWYPYIPFGKITLLQGDPGGGKSTLMMNVISAVSNGIYSNNGIKTKKPMHIIYQCSEDGVADTIKPRLISAGANCDNVAFIDEDIFGLTLNDEKIRRAIADFNAKLLVIDPFQAYLGNADMTNATSVRKVLRQLSMWANAYDCAVVLIGHLNKKQGTKDLYRGLGSIDLVAAARSVIQVEKCEDSDVRVLKHIKSSLSSKGEDLYFEINPTIGFRWLDDIEYETNIKTTTDSKAKSKQEKTAEVLKQILADGPMKASDIRQYFMDCGVSERTLLITKKFLGIESYRKNGMWYWSMPQSVE